MFRKSLAIILVFFLFWGNVGFCLNVHYCSTSDSFSLMVNHLIGEKCETETEHAQKEIEKICHSETKTCCKVSEKNPTASSCCENHEVEVKMPGVFQGSYTNFSFQKFVADFLANNTLFHFLTGGCNAFIQKLAESKPPEIPSVCKPEGKIILVNHCVYRI